MKCCCRGCIPVFDYHWQNLQSGDNQIMHLHTSKTTYLS